MLLVPYIRLNKTIFKLDRELDLGFSGFVNSLSKFTRLQKLSFSVCSTLLKQHDRRRESIYYPSANSTRILAKR